MDCIQILFQMDRHRNNWILDRHLNSQVNIDEICDMNTWCTLEKQIHMLSNKYYELSYPTKFYIIQDKAIHDIYCIHTLNFGSFIWHTKMYIYCSIWTDDSCLIEIMYGLLCGMKSQPFVCCVVFV